MTGTAHSDVMRVPIRAKVAAALFVPLLALLIFSAAEVQQAAHSTADVRNETTLAQASVGPAGIITSLQEERNWAALEGVGLQDQYPVAVRGFGPTRKKTDDAIDKFRDFVERKGGTAEATYRTAFRYLDQLLPAIRHDIDTSTNPKTLDNMGPNNAIYGRYSKLIHGLLDANAAVSLKVRDPRLRQGTELADIASRQVELDADVNRQTVALATLTPRGIDTSDEITTVATQLALFDRNNERLLAATGPYAAIVRDEYPREYAAQMHKDVLGALDTGSIGNVQAFIDKLAATPEDARYPGLRDALSEEVLDRAHDLNAGATTHQRLFVSLAVLAFAGAAAMTWLVSRSITRPLESLTRQAKHMADHRLPEAVLDILNTPPGEDVQVPPVEPVTVQTRDEVADVATVLNTVQTSALDLAVEQTLLRRNIADTFVNLGRRNQNLLGRQLDFITQLESQETDPDTLAALFRLDHLATRMRRNAESLLVLAGIDPPRKWMAPIRLVDVIRAALGEVEDFQRVQIERMEAATLLGTAAADLAHVMAELVENALIFSPPNQVVEVRGWNRHPGYTLAVVDAGLGMASDELARANRRLAGFESFTVAPSKYLGHYVAGTLAARHGIRIQLVPAEPQGIVATVDIPASLIDVADPTGRPLPAPAAWNAPWNGNGNGAQPLQPPVAPSPPAPW